MKDTTERKEREKMNCPKCGKEMDKVGPTNEDGQAYYTCYSCNDTFLMAGADDDD